MSAQMHDDTINLVHKLDDIPKKDFRTILPKELSVHYDFSLPSLIGSRQGLLRRLT